MQIQLAVNLLKARTCVFLFLDGGDRRLRRRRWGFSDGDGFLRNVIVEIERFDSVENRRRSRKKRLVLFDGSWFFVDVWSCCDRRELEMSFVRWGSERGEVNGLETVNHGRGALDLSLVRIVGFGR